MTVTGLVHHSTWHEHPPPARDHLAISTAIVLFHRYFSTHSLLLNDRFVRSQFALFWAWEGLRV